MMVLNVLRRLLLEGVTLTDTSFLQRYLSRAVDEFPVAVKHLPTYGRRSHTDLVQLVQTVKALAGVPNPSQRSTPFTQLDELEVRLKFQHILRNALEARILPASYALSSIDSLWMQQSAIIDQLAYQYSTQFSRRPRQTRRSIQYLYEYIHDQELPLTSSFIKSLVRGYIIQSMVDGTYVDAKSLIWVLQQVARVEGPAVAQRIEHTFWKWRGELIEDAHRKTGGSKRQGKARIEQVKRLGL
jgi:hypothetical protein